jgi:hypothetical protein
LRSV